MPYAVDEQDDIRLKGGSDETIIGNVGDRLKVDAIVSGSGASAYLDAEVLFSFAKGINAASSSADNPLIYFKNPAGSGKNVYFQMAIGNSTISNERTWFKAFENPTITANGTAGTIKNRTLGSSNASVVEVYYLPTVSATGDEISDSQSGENTNMQEIMGMNMLKIPPGNAILITGTPKSNNRVQSMTLIWAELA